MTMASAEGRRSVEGVVYAELHDEAEDRRVLEFNTRFGDPEAQVLMMRLEDDLLPVLAGSWADSMPSA